MFYRRNKNLQILVIDAICGFPKTTFLGLSGVKGQYSVVGGTNLLWIALLGHACLIATPGLGWNLLHSKMASCYLVFPKIVVPPNHPFK